MSRQYFGITLETRRSLITKLSCRNEIRRVSCLYKRIRRSRIIFLSSPVSFRFVAKVQFLKGVCWI